MVLERDEVVVADRRRLSWRGGVMCIKCVRRAKRLGHKPLSFGQVKAFAHSFDTNIISTPYGPLKRPIPLFRKRGINCAIEAHLYLMQRWGTNRKRYHRQSAKAVR